MKALGRKTKIATSVDLDALAQETEGFSGADLQALVYNAHLEVIHEAIPGPSASGTVPVDGRNEGSQDELVYSILGESSQTQKVLSRAEEASFQRRVRTLMMPHSGWHSHESMWIAANNLTRALGQVVRPRPCS